MTLAFFLFLLFTFAALGSLVEAIQGKILRFKSNSLPKHGRDYTSRIIHGYILSIILSFISYRLNFSPVHLGNGIFLLIILYVSSWLICNIYLYKNMFRSRIRLNGKLFSVFFVTTLTLAVSNNLLLSDLPTRIGSDYISYLTMIRVLSDNSRNEIIELVNQSEFTTTNFDVIVSSGFIEGEFPRYPAFFYIAGLVHHLDPQFVSSAILAFLIVALYINFRLLRSVIPNTASSNLLLIYVFLASPVFLPAIRDGFFPFVLASPLLTYLVIQLTRTAHLQDCLKHSPRMLRNSILGFATVLVYSDLFFIVVTFFAVQFIWTAKICRAKWSRKFQRLFFELATIVSLTYAFSPKLIKNLVQRSSELGINGFEQPNHINLFDVSGFNPIWNSLTNVAAESNKFSQVFYFLGIILSFVLVLLVFLKRRKGFPDATLYVFVVLTILVVVNLYFSRGENNYSHFRVISFLMPSLIYFTVLLARKIQILNFTIPLNFPNGLKYVNLAVFAACLTLATLNYLESKSDHAQNFNHFYVATEVEKKLLDAPIVASNYSSIAQLTSFRSLYWINRNQASLNYALAYPLGELVILINSQNTNYLNCLQSAQNPVKVGERGSFIVLADTGREALESELNLHKKIALAFPKAPIYGDELRAINCLS